MAGRRLSSGGTRIDRTRPVRFKFGGRSYTGYAGDTLASALLAAGVSVVGRSFKYHRPRGLLAAGVEEPNALVQVGSEARTEVNLRATEVTLYDGLVATPVNCWPNAKFDLGSINSVLSRFIPAGFYYKTFMWPDWHLFEPLIRKAAGLGRPSALSDPDRYEARFAHCDLLVVGAGPAGLAAALAGSRRGERVILVEQDSELGGSLLWDPVRIDGRRAADWISNTAAELNAAPDTLVLTRTTTIGYFDHNSLSLVERVTEHLSPNTCDRSPKQRLWQVRARKVVLATGALERPLVFPGNDRPGVILASSVRQYLQRWAVLPGGRAVIFTNNDSAYDTAHALLDAGGRVAAVVDSRLEPPPDVSRALANRGIKVLTGASVVATQGFHRLTSVMVRDRSSQHYRISADLLAMSGGWNPTVHLFSQSGGNLVWDTERALFKPGVSAQAEISVGAAAGEFDLQKAFRQGWEAGGASGLASRAEMPRVAWTIEPLWRVEAPGKAFVDFQNDVSTDDIALAYRESFRSVEHLKRYTTLGMAPDQGKTSNVNALALMASLTGQDPGTAGTTRFRPPFIATTFGAIGGRRRGQLFEPMRRLPAHDRHSEANAVFEDYGGWLRPAYYLRPGETPHDAEQREALTVRNHVGLFDGSPLGKIEVIGPDAAEFLDRIYANTMSNLAVGRARYGLMLNELGVVIDDGVTGRLAEDRFLVGTSGAGSARIAAWLEEWLQCEWRTLRVLIAPVTSAWAVLTVSGPKARAVLEATGCEGAVDAASFPHMSFRECRIAGIEARIFRVSYTGELTYEINIAADRAIELWDKLVDAGRASEIAPVGVDAWMLLRTEKGFLHIGADTDGSTTPDDIGWGHVLKRHQDFVGRRSLTLPENARADRLHYVGIEAVDSSEAIPVGSHVRARSAGAGSEGYITSAGFSPILGRGVALGMVRQGRSRHGEELEIVTGPALGRLVRVTAPGMYDPDGKRING